MTESILGRFDLADEIARYAPAEGASGRRAETLVKTDQLRVVLVTMRGGAELHEHHAPGPITIQALRGQLVARVAGDEFQLQPGNLIAVAAGVRHAVQVEGESAFLLTIGAGSAPI